MDIKKYLLVISLSLLVVITAIPIANAAPDLVITTISSVPEVELGVPFTATVTMANQGDSDVESPDNGASVSYSVYLSLDNSLDESDICAGVGGIFYQILTAGSIRTSEVTLQVNTENTPTAQYYLIAKADALCNFGGHVAESDETNNTLTGDLASVIASNAVIDLSMTDLISPIHISRGEWFRVDTSITNLGPDTAPGRAVSSCGHYTGFYLSTDTTITSDDLLLSRICLNSLAGGTTLRWWHDVLIPSDVPRGFYYLGVMADYTKILDETDETNNTFVAGNKVRVK